MAHTDKASGTQAFITRLLEFSIRHSWLVILLVVVLSGFFGYYATKVDINPDVDGLVSEQDEIGLLIDKYGSKDLEDDHMVLAVTADDPFTLKRLQLLYSIVEEIEAVPGSAKSINPFNMITFRKDGRRLEVLTMSSEARAPANEEELERFEERLLSDPFARNLVVSEDGQTLAVLVPITQTARETEYVDRIRKIVEPLEEEFDTALTGGVVLSDAVKKYLIRDFTILLTFAVLVIIIIYYLGYRAFRSAFLTLIVVGLGTLWSLGFMALLGFTISVVSICTPPLVLTLGSSYTIHILNQYYREARNGNGGKPEGEKKTKKLWIAGAVTHASRTVILASATTVIGFMSLLATTLKPTREFGIATSFGIVTCAVLSFFFLPAMLKHMRPPTPKQKSNVLEGYIATLMGKISCFVLRRRWWILAFFIAIIAGFFASRSGLQYQTFVINYFPTREEIVQDTNSIYRELKGFDQFNITVTAPEGEKNYFLDRDVLEQIAAFEDRIIQDPDITKIYSFASYLRHLNYVMTGERKIPESRPLILLLSRYIRTLADEPEFKNMIGNLANEDFSRMDLIVWCYNHETETISGDISLKRMMKNVQAEMDAGLKAEWDPAMWGVTLKVVSVSDLIQRDQQLSTILSMIFVFILTTIAFRSFRYGIVSLVPLATGILLNFILMVIFGIPMDMTTVMFSIVVIGVGVDNSIHFLLRFREQAKAYPDDIGQILFHTLRIAGRPIIITTSSIIGGLLVLTFASFKPIIYFGLLVAMALFTAAFGTLFVLPSILSLFWTWRLKKQRKTGLSSPE